MISDEGLQVVTKTGRSGLHPMHGKARQSPEQNSKMDHLPQISSAGYDGSSHQFAVPQTGSKCKGGGCPKAGNLSGPTPQRWPKILPNTYLPAFLHRVILMASICVLTMFGTTSLNQTTKCCSWQKGKTQCSKCTSPGSILRAL